MSSSKKRTKNQMFALGSNSCGQLGIGHREDVDVLTPCRFRDCYTGERSAMTTTTTAQVATATTTTTPAQTDLSSSASPSPFGTTSEKTYDGSSGGGAINNVAVASSELPSAVRKIVAGGNHTLVLLENGTVYATGDREALGAITGLEQPRDGSKDNLDSDACFQRVAWLDGGKVKVDTFADVSATWSASFFVVDARDGDQPFTGAAAIFVVGKGERGELGLGKDCVVSNQPKQVAVFHTEETEEKQERDVLRIRGKMTGIWSSVGHTVICCSEPPNVYGWGACRKGQLGEKLRDEKVVWKPQKLAYEDLQSGSKINQVSSVALGRDFSFFRVAAEEQEEKVWQWRLLGGNRFLENNPGHLTDFLNALQIFEPGHETVGVGKIAFASWSNLYCLDRRTRDVKALGRNDHGQLLPAILPGLDMMAVGSEHCVGWTAQGTLALWGWGEHGNCGRESDRTGHGWSVLEIPTSNSDSVVGVGAGCATTFAWVREG